MRFIFCDVVATFLGYLTFFTADTRYSDLCNTGNMTFQIKWPTLIQFYCNFFFKGKRREREKTANLFLFLHLFFNFILKGEVLCSRYFPLHWLMRRSAESADRVKEQPRWDGCCWSDSLGHYLSSCCKCWMTLSFQVTEYHKACTFKNAYGFLHAYLLLTRYMFLLLN